MQRWINLNGKEGNVTIVSPQAALFEIGEMVNENKVLNGHKQWKTSAASSAFVFLYALNNYWHTNFKADQEGPVQFDIYFRFGTGPFSQAEAERFSQNCLEPCTAPALYRQIEGTRQKRKDSALTGYYPVILTNSRALEQGLQP